MARKNEIVIIGAGTFGATVAEKLSEISKYTVIVVDQDGEKVDTLAKLVDAGFVGNSANEEFLDSLGLKNTGVFVIGIGDNVQDSILITSMIKKKFPKARVVAKASDLNHGDVLESLGVHDVISPEITAARRAVVKIINPQLSKDLKESQVQEMDGGLSLIRIPAPIEYVGKTVMEITLPTGTAINVIYKKNKPSIVTGKTIIKKTDELVLIGKTKIVYKLASDLASE